MEEQHYTGVFTHPSVGSDEIAIEVTLTSPSEGVWNAMGQTEKITVQREGKNIIMSDEAGTTTLDGRVGLGGRLVGSVSQDGVDGGKFRLQLCQKSQAIGSGTLLKRTRVQRHVQIPVVPVARAETFITTRWRAVGIPARLAVQSAGEVGWRTSYQVAFA